MGEFRTMMRRAYKTEPIDQYLSSIGLYRKITAKDGSCLFRAVAEQIFYTQVFHYAVRKACINFMSQNREQFEPFIPGSFEHYLFHLKNPKEWAGQVEISALSLLYKRDFLVYQLPGKPPSDVTQNGFQKKITLCFSHGNHYDSVFTRTFQHNAAVCQSVLYEILYKEVFKVPREADQAVEILRESSSEEIDERLKRRPPLPYRVAKALDPEIYRNVEFDSWNENKKDQQQQDLIMARGLQYSPGERCQVALGSDGKKYFEGHIQEVSPGDGSVTVFIPEIGEKRTVPMKNLRPVVSFPQHMPQRMPGGGSYKSLPGYYQKYGPQEMVHEGMRHRDRGPRRGRPNLPMSMPFSPSNGLPYDQQNIPYPHPSELQTGRVRQRLPSPHKQAPRFLNRNINQNEPYMSGGGGPPHRRGKYDSHRVNPPMMDVHDDPNMEGHQDLQETLRYIELAERDPMAFPALPGGSNGQGDSPSHAFWSRYRSDQNGRSSISPSHPGTPSPVNLPHHREEMDERILTGQMQHMNIAVSDFQRTRLTSSETLFDSLPKMDERMLAGQMHHMSIAGNAPIEQEAHYTITVKPGGEMEMGPPGVLSADSSPVPSWSSPSSIMTSSTGYQMTPSSGPSPHGPSPQTVYSSSPIPQQPQPQPVSLGLPFYPMLLPVTENLIGPINQAADISREPTGQDLPSDVSTLRYFYNLGVEYQRRILMIQYQQQQQSAVVQPAPYIPLPAVTMYSTMPLVHANVQPMVTPHMTPHMTPQDPSSGGHVVMETGASASSLEEEGAQAGPEEAEDRQISAASHVSGAQHLAETHYPTPALSSHSHSQSVHPIHASAAYPTTAPQVIYRQPVGAQLSTASYMVPAQWQPYGGNQGKVAATPMSISPNAPSVTLLTTNAPIHVPHMQPHQQPHQHIMHQAGQQVLTPTLHGVAPASMYSPT